MTPLKFLTIGLMSIIIASLNSCGIYMNHMDKHDLRHGASERGSASSSEAVTVLDDDKQSGEATVSIDFSKLESLLEEASQEGPEQEPNAEPMALLSDLADVASPFKNNRTYNGKTYGEASCGERYWGISEEISLEGEDVRPQESSDFAQSVLRWKEVSLFVYGFDAAGNPEEVLAINFGMIQNYHCYSDFHLRLYDLPKDRYVMYLGLEDPYGGYSTNPQGSYSGRELIIECKAENSPAFECYKPLANPQDGPQVVDVGVDFGIGLGLNGR